MSTVYLPNTQRGLWSCIDEITPVKAFKVGGSIYATPKQAAKKMAWGLILAKYSDIATQAKIEDLKKVFRYECDCMQDHERGNFGQIIGFKHEICQIHDRKTGYFKRLHTRLVNIILARYEQQVAQ